MAGRVPRVLVVGDEAVIRQLIVINLELEGFEVHQAADGLDALDKAREIDPDVVTLDVMMPRLDGWATAQRLRADPSTCRARIVFISARTRPADADPEDRYGAGNGCPPRSRSSCSMVTISPLCADTIFAASSRT